jgi:hypothetical protein
MKNKRKQQAQAQIKALEDALTLLRNNVKNSLITSEQAVALCSFDLNIQLAAIRELFEKDIKSPYEENAEVYFEGVLWTVKDYEGDLLAIKKGNDVKLVRASEVSLTAPVPAVPENAPIVTKSKKN